MTIPTPTPPPDDLARQARLCADAIRSKDQQIVVLTVEHAYVLLQRLADEIERLTAEVERLRAENARLKATGEAFGPAMQMMVAKLKERQW